MREGSKPSKDKLDYENLYEYRRQWLSCFEKDYEEIVYPKSYSFFIKSGSVPVTGKVFTPPTPIFEIEIDINKCLTALKDKFLTKGGKLRVSMENLKEWEVMAWSELLNYVWLEKRDGIESKVLLSKKEYGMLFMDNKSNKSVSKSKTINKKK